MGQRGAQRRAGTGLLLGAALLTVLAAGPAAGAPPAPPAVAVFDGRGHGHGVGMAQDGARTLAERGASALQVLGTFFPGTTLGTAAGSVTVSVWDGGAATEVTLPSGGRVDGGGRTLPVPAGGRVALSRDGGSVLAREASAPGTPAPAADTAAVPPPEVRGAPLVVTPTDGGTTGVAASGRTYRGTVRVLADGGGLRLVNEVDLEDYLTGLGEAGPGWPAAALEAQAVASRSYAVASRVSPDFRLWDDTRSQVYLGTGGEYPAQRRAVEATRGLVLRYAGAVVPAYFSTHGGGVTATAQEGFGGPGASSGPPWLRAAPYPTDDVGRWQETVPLRRVAARLGYPGRLTGVVVEQRGPSGRALGVVLSGDAGRRRVGGVALQRALGLRSTLFAVVVPAPRGAATPATAAAPAASAVPLPPPPPALPVPAAPVPTAPPVALPAVPASRRLPAAPVGLAAALVVAGAAGVAAAARGHLMRTSHVP